MFLWRYLATLLLITVEIHKARSCEEFTHLNLGHAIIGTSLRVKLLLYTRENATCGELLSHSNFSTNPRFNLSRPSIFIVHGLRPTGSPPVWVHKLSDALLARTDVNVLVVDWNYGAANVNYMKAVENTRKAANNLTAFIKLMNDSGASLSSIHMIGVSLGAHMSGFVGADLSGTLGRITALDPAGPLFTGHPPENRLDPTDAQFVDVLHTDMDALGFREALGHVDFFANGGSDQPGCPKTILSGGSYFKCDHQRSVLLFMESIDQTCAIRAFPCSSYMEFLDGKCLNCERFGAAGCPVFGYDVTDWKDVLQKVDPTKMYFTTNEQVPFCKTGYRVGVTVWNSEVRWGFMTIKLHGDGGEAVATINHKATKFERFIETNMFAQFDKDVQPVSKVSLKFSTGSVFQPKRKLRILWVHFTPVAQEERALCRYDILLEEDKEVTLRPIPCENSSL